MKPSNTHVLPDSRLVDPKGTYMRDWPVRGSDGVVRIVKLEMEHNYCINCGKPGIDTPRALMSFVSYLCPKCAEDWGEHANLWEHSDEEFWKAVAHEMEARYGHVLSQEELDQEAANGTLGPALMALDRDSPYRGKNWNG